MSWTDLPFASLSSLSLKEPDTQKGFDEARQGRPGSGGNRKRHGTRGLGLEVTVTSASGSCREQGHMDGPASCLTSCFCLLIVVFIVGTGED